MRIAIGCLLVGAALSTGGLARANDSEQFRRGEALFKEFCVMCHGENGRGGQGYANPIWGAGAQIKKFKNAQGLFEYHQLLMPFNDPALLNDEQKWAVTAYVLANHAVLGRGDTLDPATAVQLTIP